MRPESGPDGAFAPDGDAALGEALDRGALDRIARSRSVEAAVAAELRRAILDGSLAPGARLTMRGVAARLEVSMTPVRIAMTSLAGEGLLELRPHTGAWVAPLSVEEVEEILLTRSAIEPWLALHGAPRLADDDLAEIDARLEAATAATSSEDRDAYLRTTWEARAVCYRAAARPRLLSRVETLYAHARRYHMLNLADADRMRRSLAFMERLRAACADRDGRAAEGAMRDAIAWTLDYLTRDVVAAMAPADRLGGRPPP